MVNVSSRIDFNSGDNEGILGRSYLVRGEKPDLESLIRADPLSDNFLNSSTSFLKESGILIHCFESFAYVLMWS